MLPENYELFSEDRPNIPWELAREVYTARIREYTHPQELVPRWFERSVLKAGTTFQAIAAGDAVLDVGGGKGVVGGAFFAARGVPVTILDAWWYPDRPKPSNLILGDAREVAQIFAGKRFWWVQATEILEHLPKAEGPPFLEALKEVTAHILMISTPYCYLHQPVQEDGNPYQVHLSGWLPQELEALGFTLYFNASQMFGFWSRR